MVLLHLMITLVLVPVLWLMPALKVNDPIEDALDKAKGKYKAAAEQAKNDLLKAFDEKTKAAAEAGKLDLVKQLMTEKSAFDADGKLTTVPSMRTAVADFQQAIKKARNAMFDAYEAAIKDYTKGLMVDKASGVQTEYQAFKNEGTQPSTGKPSAPAAPAGSLKVVSALWGIDGRNVDVRAIVQSQLDRGMVVRAGNPPLELRADPAPGHVKFLKLELQVGETRFTVLLPEGGTLALKK